MTTDTPVTRDAPVLFRITSVTPNPFPDHDRDTVMAVRLDVMEPRVGRPESHELPLTHDRVDRYGELLRQAVASGTLYWVDWPEQPDDRPDQMRHLVDRVLFAVEGNQFAPEETVD